MAKKRQKKEDVSKANAKAGKGRKVNITKSNNKLAEQKQKDGALSAGSEKERARLNLLKKVIKPKIKKLAKARSLVAK